MACSFFAAISGSSPATVVAIGRVLLPSSLISIQPTWEVSQRTSHRLFPRTLIIMIVNIEAGFLTPPFGLNLFVSMALAKTTLVEVAKAVLPFSILFLFCLLTITFIPKISLLLPELLLR